VEALGRHLATFRCWKQENQSPPTVAVVFFAASALGMLAALCLVAQRQGFAPVAGLLPFVMAIVVADSLPISVPGSSLSEQSAISLSSLVLLPMAAVFDPGDFALSLVIAIPISTLVLPPSHSPNVWVKLLGAWLALVYGLGLVLTSVALGGEPTLLTLLAAGLVTLGVSLVVMPTAMWFAGEIELGTTQIRETARFELVFECGMVVPLSAVIAVAADTNRFLLLVPLVPLCVLVGLSRAALRAGEMERKASLDPLTGLFNRRGLYSAVADDLVKAIGAGQTMMFCMGDIDHFKRLNDTFGHDVGDEALCRVGRVFASRAEQGQGHAVRLGGEELLLVLPVGSSAEALERANDLRRSVRVALGDLEGSISLGVVLTEQLDEWRGIDPPTLVDGLLKEADGLLYLAKEKGRDRVEVAA
jgi:diguanylate cyclase (GGDEF)-like protein